MPEDLKQKGDPKAAAGGKPDEKVNKEIYMHWEFTEPGSIGAEAYPDGTVIHAGFMGDCVKEAERRLEYGLQSKDF